MLHFFNQPGFLLQNRPSTRLGLELGIPKETALSFGITSAPRSRSWSLGKLATPRTAWGKWHCGIPSRITCTQNAAMIQLNSNISSVNIKGPYERNWIEAFLLSILREVTGVTQLRQFVCEYCDIVRSFGRNWIDTFRLWIWIYKNVTYSVFCGVTMWLYYW